MGIIKNLSEMISEEIGDAAKYAECALKHKEDMPKLSELFYRLSKDEMSHAEQLHDAVVEIIRDWKARNGEPPEGMMAVYAYLHDKQIEETTRVRAMQSMYSNG